MSMELMPVARKYLSKDLQKVTDRISAYDMKIRSNQYAIAFLMNIVSERKLYEQDGFDSAIDWAKDAFSIEKSTAYNLLILGRYYVEEVRDEKGSIVGYCSNLVPRDEHKLPVVDFTPHNVIMLSSMGREKILQAISEGTLKLTTTANDIRAIVKAYRALRATEKKESEKPVQPTTTEPSAQEPAQSTTTELRTSEPEQPMTAEPIVQTAFIDHNRDNGWDNASTGDLVAELGRRGFEVYRDGVRYDIRWPN